jgi:hypothetical protein
MMTKLEERVSNFKYALSLKRIMKDAKRRRKAAAGYARAAEAHVAVEENVRGLLATEPVPYMMAIWYMTYAKSIGRLQRENRDLRQFKSAVGPLTEKWLARGLQKNIMQRIRMEMFDLPE